MTSPTSAPHAVFGSRAACLFIILVLGSGYPVAGRALEPVARQADPPASAAVDIYDSVTDSWNSATLSEARYEPETVVVGGLLLVAGGLVGQSRQSQAVDIFD